MRAALFDKSSTARGQYLTIGDAPKPTVKDGYVLLGHDGYS